MRGLGARQGVAAVAAAALLVTACGGDDSSGLATLAGTATSAPSADPEASEPVPEPTAVTQPGPETTEAIGPASSVVADSADIEVDEATGALSTTEPVDEPSVESEDMAGEESAAPGNATGEEFAEPGSGAGEVSVDTENMTDEESLLAFAECMRENGVDFPDPVVEADGTVTFGFRPGGGGGGLQALREIGQDPDLPAARDTCSGMLEGRAFGPGQGDFDLIELQDRLLEFAQCMRDNGVDMPDPDLGRFGPGGNDNDQDFGPFRVIEIETEIDDDSDFAAAFVVCQQQLPQAGSQPFGGGN